MVVDLKFSRPLSSFAPALSCTWGGVTMLRGTCVPPCDVGFNLICMRYADALKTIAFVISPLSAKHVKKDVTVSVSCAFSLDV